MLSGGLRLPRRMGTPGVLKYDAEFQVTPDRPVPTRGRPSGGGHTRGCISPSIEHPSGCDERSESPWSVNRHKNRFRTRDKKTGESIPDQPCFRHSSTKCLNIPRLARG
jgi:hypothetical protein